MRGLSQHSLLLFNVRAQHRWSSVDTVRLRRREKQRACASSVAHAPQRVAPRPSQRLGRLQRCEEPHDSSVALRYVFTHLPMVPLAHTQPNNLEYIVMAGFRACMLDGHCLVTPPIANRDEENGVASGTDTLGCTRSQALVIGLISSNGVVRAVVHNANELESQCRNCGACNINTGCKHHTCCSTNNRVSNLAWPRRTWWPHSQWQALCRRGVPRRYVVQHPSSGSHAPACIPLSRRRLSSVTPAQTCAAA